MTFDKPEHKKLVWDVLQQISIPAQHVDLFVEVREAVRSAGITPASAPTAPIDGGQRRRRIPAGTQKIPDCKI